MNEESTERYIETDSSVFFPKVGLVFHVSFSNSYRRMNIIQVRRKLKVYFTKSQQDEIIHYLRKKSSIKT